MITIDTYRARITKELYRHGVYPPDYMNVADVVDAIVGSGDRDTAVRAIRKTALDDFSPVFFVRGSNQQAITLGRGAVTDINDEIRDWINLWDESELPPELQ